MDERVNVASVQFEGEAVQWHLAFTKYRKYLHSPAWSEYAMALVERFGSDYNDPMEEIKKVSCYLGGLKNKLNMAVKIANLRTLSQVYKSARMQEAYLEAMKQPVQNFSHNRRYGRRFLSKPPLLPTPTSNAVTPTSKGVSRKTLSPEEMNEKRSKGLCYFCNEKSLGFKTLRVIGYHSKKPLHILVDTGSSHNFIDLKVVKDLGFQATSTTPQVVTTANGNNMQVSKMCRFSWLLQGMEFSAEFLLLPLGFGGVVLGVQWLLTLGDIKMNFRNLTMEFWYKGRKHILKGVGRQVKTTGAGKLAKISGINS
ncbi:hypothetical protein T459_22743 [Capsicum annuum]|uniref:Retrotransposon gag domain-containing protein n=1 Tax=Capsicum annuum TaxID=4072 RepID=A0A2G2YQD0_CAPAN|nr:hypothetical protein T459_22743 [Capsicum annuum]